MKLAYNLRLSMRVALNVCIATILLAPVTGRMVYAQGGDESGYYNIISVGEEDDTAVGDKPRDLESITVIGNRIIEALSDTTALDGATHAQPLSVVTLSRDELQDLGARDLSQALQTVAAVSVPPAIMTQPQSGYNVRGFRASVLYDGFSSLGMYGDRDSLVGVESVHFVKGPGSALNAGARGLPPGGVMDIHSMWPGESVAGNGTLSGARLGVRDFSLEGDSGNLLPFASLGIAAHRGEGRSFYDFSLREAEKIRPSMSLRGFGGRLSIYYEDSWRTTRDHPGLPTSGTLDQTGFSIPGSRSVNDPDVPLSTTSVRAYGLDGELPLGTEDWLTIALAARVSHSAIQQASQFVSSNSPDTDPSGIIAPSTFNRLAGTYVGGTKETQGRVRITARYAPEKFGRFTGWMTYGGANAPDRVELRIDTATPLDLADPTYSNWREPSVPFAEASSLFHIRNLSGGVQWRFGKWLNAFVVQTQTRGRVSNRQTSVIGQFVGDSFGDDLQAQTESLLFPLLATGAAADTGLFILREDLHRLNALQFGLAVRLWDAGSSVVDDGLWLFYGKGNGHQFQAYFSGEGKPEPELSKQQEAGIRLVSHGWGRVEATTFRIQRRNVPTLDPNGVTGFEQIVSGLQSVRGADLEVSIWPPFSGWDRLSLHGSAAWLNSRIDEDATFPAGNELINVPRRNWRLQLAADLLRGHAPLRAFVAHGCRSSVKGDLNNSFTVPSRCLTDVGATFIWKGLALDVVVNNLADVQYYEAYSYLFNGVIPGPRRNLRVTLGYEFGSEY